MRYCIGFGHSSRRAYGPSHYQIVFVGARVSRVSLSLLSYVGFHPVNREHSDKELTVSTLCCVVSELNEGFPLPFGFHPVNRDPGTRSRYR